MRFAALFLVLCFVVTPAQTRRQTPAENKKAFTSTEGGFSASFPGKPASSETRYEERGYVVEGRQFNAIQGAELYNITYGNLPYDASLEERFDSAIDRMKNVDASIVEVGRKSITISGCSGYAWRGRTNRYPVIAMQLVVTPVRLYLIAFMSTSRADKTTAARMNRFFNSFKLLEGSACDER